MLYFILCWFLHTKVEFTYFLFHNKIYKQIKGLAMGNRLAQILAEIRTNFALYVALNEFDAEDISFLYKFVDDIFTSIYMDQINNVKEKISKTVGMEPSLTREDTNLAVEFFKSVFRRNQNSTVSSRWLKKNYSCLSILNYHSYHPIDMKLNVAIEMIKNAHAITSPEFVEHSQSLLDNILKRSSYHERFIIENVQIKPFIVRFLRK